MCQISADLDVHCFFVSLLLLRREIYQKRPWCNWKLLERVSTAALAGRICLPVIPCN